MTENNLPQTGSVGFEGLQENQRLRGWMLVSPKPPLPFGPREWRRFENAGYKGLYGGLGAEAIKARKRIPEKEQLMDRMDTTELAANQFRMTQTRDKLARQQIHNQEHAIETHKQVGREVREAIKRIGGTLPENLPPAEHIKQVEKRIKHTPPKLALDGPAAKGWSAKNLKRRRARTENRHDVSCSSAPEAQVPFVP